MANILKNQIELKAETRELRKEVRHLHHLVTKKHKKSSSAENESEEEEILSDYIPCDTYSDLQQLEEKLWDKEFFERSVSITVSHNLLGRHPLHKLESTCVILITGN